MLIYVLISARTRHMLEELAVALKESEGCLLIECHLESDPSCGVLELITALIPGEPLHLGGAESLCHLAELLGELLA